MNDIIRIPAHPNNYTRGRNKQIQYIVIHYTANNGDTAIGNGNYFAQPNRNASAHYFVDEKNIVQSVMDTSTAWHCGAKTYKHSRCRNDNSIGIEMCSEKDKNGKYYINLDTQRTAISLIKELMNKYNIPIENIVRHYDVTGKFCPEPFVRVEQEWISFKEKIQIVKGVNEMEHRYNKIEEIPEYASPVIKKLIDDKALLGDKEGNLDLSKDMIRMFSVLDRYGLFK